MRILEYYKSILRMTEYYNS